MKTIFLLIVCIIGLNTNLFSQEQTLEAFFQGYDTEEKLYFFEDAYGDVVEFMEVKASLLKTYNLKSPKLVGKAYEITYIIEEIEEEDGFIYDKMIIVNLKPITLERIEEEEEED